MTRPNLLEQPVLPPNDIELLEQLSKFLFGHSEQAMLRSPDGAEVAIPPEVYEVLLTVVDAMNQGKAITVAPVNLRLSTQEAAGLLGISRPSVVKLLEERVIPYEQAGNGRHRKIRLSDLLEYQIRTRVERRAELTDMVKRASEEGLYGEQTPEDYLDVVAKVRRRGSV
jgi:excisionase family DNA binding protein